MTETAAPIHRLTASGGPKKKFATPPVKIACLSCRASRTRCDGGRPCASCKTRSRDCFYQPSRRGGARIRKKPRPSQDITPDGAAGMPGLELGEAMPLDRMPNEPPEPIAIESYIEPGAGLAHLQDWSQDSDFIFDSLFMDELAGFTSGGSGDSASEVSSSAASQSLPMVRAYRGDRAILDAYYVFIHPFFPILPAPLAVPVDQPVCRFQSQVDDLEDLLEPSSSISLAISAVLALIPHPDDANHRTAEAVLFRRKYAHYFAQSAIESIEVENEIPESSVEPPKALESLEDPLRLPFHPGVPLELESIIALDILSIYEYAQRGNLKKMQSRAGQALVAAMGQSLHLGTDEEDDIYAEAKQRVWWMTFVSVCQGSIVSNSKPTFEVFVPSFTRKFPSIPIDPEAFSVFIQSQQAILAATQFVIELNKAMESNTGMAQIYDKMRELEIYLEPLNTQAELWDLKATTTSPVDPSEEVVSRSLRAMARIKLNSARIKLHRFCAFFDLPVFSGKHCDLKAIKPDGGNQADELKQWPWCSCSPMHNVPSALAPVGSETVTPQLATVWPSPGSDENHTHQTSPLSSSHSAMFPFSSHLSAKICLKSALSIAASFEGLPYPNPAGRVGMAQCYLGPASTVVAPRTMPSFACCAMQCAYVLLMVHHKTNSMYLENSRGSLLVDSLLVRLQGALTSILGTLENYGTAFEALGGMRDQIRGAMQPVWPLEMSLDTTNAF